MLSVSGIDLKLTSASCVPLGFFRFPFPSTRLLLHAVHLTRQSICLLPYSIVIPYATCLTFNFPFLDLSYGQLTSRNVQTSFAWTKFGVQITKFTASLLHYTFKAAIYFLCFQFSLKIQNTSCVLQTASDK